LSEAGGARAPRPLPALHRVAPGLYYGWIVALGCGVLSFATVGIGFYGMGVFLDALTAERGLGRAEVAGPTSLYFVTAGLAGIGVGRLVDRRGARGAIVAGALLMALCLVALGRLREARSLWFVYPLMAVGFSLSTSIPINAIVTRWFVGLRARAMSVSQSGVSLGGIVLVPLATEVAASRGLEAATLLLAGVLLAVALPVTALVLRFDPREHGLLPDGAAASADATRGRNPLLEQSRQLRAWRPREALATRTFWTLALAFGAILFCQQSVLVHQIALLRERTGDPRIGAFAVSVTAFASIGARLLVGGFADRVSKRRLASRLMALQAVALCGLSLAPDLASVYAAAFVFGTTIGNVYMLQALLVGEMFGLASFGSVLGLLNLITQVAGGLGPAALGLMRDAWGGYERALVVLAGVALLAALAVSRVPVPRPSPGC
jgi:sugar phosphate permease